uniref:CCHC-type domain-containing protein n=1 Tax=Heterorhabditis bacteriophora TaxID=37862 RepID=A0A1I7X2M1_HETBA
MFGIESDNIPNPLPMRDPGSQPILAQIYERLAVIEQKVTRISHMLGEVTSDTMYCIFCNRDNHISDHCVLNIHRKYQVLGEKQLCSKCLKSYKDAEHIIPCMARCEKCEEGHHSPLHSTSNKIVIRRPTKAQRERKFTLCCFVLLLYCEY